MRVLEQPATDRAEMVALLGGLILGVPTPATVWLPVTVVVLVACISCSAFALNLGALGALAAYLVHSFVDFNLHIPANVLLMAFVFGILTNAGVARESEDSRYVALTLPHVLGRLPYGADFKRVEEFNFEEMVDGKEHDKYLWMNAAWAYGARITDAMAKYGWMARTRGVEGGGKVEGLPVHTFPTDDGDVAMKCPTEIAISERRVFE